MDNNLDTPILKKRVIISPLLGVISLMLTELIRSWGTGINYGSARVFLIGIIIAVGCSTFGLIFGIKGLKSTQRWLAIIGIIVSLIGIYYSAGGLITWLIMGGPIWL